MILAIRVPCVRLAAALRHAPDAAVLAYLIERTGPRRVLEASPAAAATGLQAGTTLREAVRLLPRAAIVLDDAARAAAAWRRVLDVLATLPVAVDDGGLGLAFAVMPRGDAAERWFRRVRARLGPTGLTVRCGAGANRFVALVAAHRGDDAVCPPGREATFVADAPLALIGIDESIALRLNLLGVRTLGQLAALPPAYLRRFGADAARWHALAHGQDDSAAAAGVW